MRNAVSSITLFPGNTCFGTRPPVFRFRNGVFDQGLSPSCKISGDMGCKLKDLTQCRLVNGFTVKRDMPTPFGCLCKEHGVNV